MKRVLAFKLVLVSAFFMQASFVFAQGEDLIKAETELDESIAELKEEPEAIKSQEEIDAENAEILKRVDAFEKVLVFTKLEIMELSEKFENIELEFGDDLWDFYKAIRKHLIDSERERNVFEQRVADNNSNLDGIKALATEFKKWREDGYDGRNEAFFDFAILAKSSNLLKVSDERVKKIDRDLKRFEDEFGELGSLQLSVLFAQAQLELGQAKDLQSKAIDLFEERFSALFFVPEEAENESQEPELGEDALNEELPVEESDEISSEMEAEEENIEEGADEELSEDEDIAALVEMALTKFQRAYQIFIDMSELAEQLLREE